MPNIAEGMKPLAKTIPIFFVIDTSGSMSGARIQAVNEAMAKVVPSLKKLAASVEALQFSVRVITFGGSSAQWKVGSKNSGIDLTQFDWISINEHEVDGGTPSDKAMELLASVMGKDFREYLGGYVGTPFIILISDGESNGHKPFRTAVDEFRATRIGNNCIQVAIGIETVNNPVAADELKYFGKNGFMHCTEDVQKLSEVISFATIKSATTAIEASEKNTNDTGNQDMFGTFNTNS